MGTSSWTAASAQPASLRRRGAVLERAILEAALEQLSTVGWNGLTMEGVAAGALANESPRDVPPPRQTGVSHGDPGGVG